METSENNRLTVKLPSLTFPGVNTVVKTNDMLIFLESRCLKHSFGMFCFKIFIQTKKSVIVTAILKLLKQKQKKGGGWGGLT